MPESAQKRQKKATQERNAELTKFAEGTIIANRFWTVSQAECLDCWVTWTAQHPLGAGHLYCPRCRGHNTVRFEPPGSDEK